MSLNSSGLESNPLSELHSNPLGVGDTRDAEQMDEYSSSSNDDATARGRSSVQLLRRTPGPFSNETSSSADVCAPGKHDEVLSSETKEPIEMMSPVASEGQKPSASYHPENAEELKKLSFSATWKMSWIYARADVLRKGNRRNVFIGLAAVFLVVLFVLLLQTTLDKLDLVFLKLAEDSAGEMDAIMFPKITNSSALPFFNGTYVQEELEPEEFVHASVLRWPLSTSSYYADNVSTSFPTLVVGIDSEYEDLKQIGRTWTLPPLSAGECWIGRNLFTSYGVPPAQNVTVNVVFSLSAISKTASSLGRSIDEDEARQILADFVVAQIDTGTGDPDTCLAEINATQIEPQLQVIREIAVIARDNNNTVNVSDILSTISEINITDIDNIANLTDILPFEIPDGVNATDFLRTIVDGADTVNASALQTLFDNIDNYQTVIDAIDSINETNCLTKGTADALIEDVLVPAILDGNLTVIVPYTVVGIMNATEGRFPSSLKTSVVVEAQQLLENATLQLYDQLVVDSPLLSALDEALGLNLSISDIVVNSSRDSLEDSLTSLRISDFSISASFVAADRISIYLQTLPAIRTEVTAFVNNIFNVIGESFVAEMATPVVSQLEGFQFFRFLIDQVAYSVVAVIIILGSMLIYALLQGTVARKTYEYGILRSMGLRQSNLFQILSISTSIFVIPGIIFGMACALLLSTVIIDVLADFARVESDYTPVWSAVVTAVLIGSLVPFLTIVLPARKAMKRPLRAALSLYETAVGQVTVSARRLSDLHISVWQFTLAFSLVVGGFLVYYVVPYSFFFQSFSAFFAVLNVLLMGILIGMVMLAVILQPLMDRIYLRLLLWGTGDRRLYTLIQKNLWAHRSRASKTATMFTLSLSFVLFLGASFLLIGDGLENGLEMFVGSDLQLRADDIDNALDTESLSPFLDSEISAGRVRNYTYITYEARDLEYVDQIRLATLSGFHSIQVEMYGVQENYLRSTYISNYEIDESASGLHYTLIGGKPNVIEALYTYMNESGLLFPEVNATEAAERIVSGLTDPPSPSDLSSSYTSNIELVVSEATRLRLSATTETALRVEIRFTNASRSRVLARAFGMVRKFPGLFFSPYRSAAWLSPILVSLPSYRQLLEENLRGSSQGNVLEVSREIPMQRCLILLKEGISSAEKEVVKQGLLALIDADTVSLTDTQQSVSDTKETVDFMMLFFNIVGVIAAALAFFILILNTAENILENRWESGVLRAIGLSSVQLRKTYIYESMALILSTISAGTVIGLLTSLVMSATFNIFLQQSSQLRVPLLLYLSEVGMALAVGFWGSYWPSREIRSNAVANVLRD